MSYRERMAGGADFTDNTQTLLCYPVVILSSLLLSIFETKIGGSAYNL